MTRETNRRPRRVPRTSEEISQFIALRKRREYQALLKLKATRTFKWLNIFNIVCFFVYIELIFCYFGPCHYQTHYTYNIAAHMGNEHKANGKTIITDMDVYSLDGETYSLVINDFIEVPPKLTQIKIGKDYILQKKIKAVLAGSTKSYRIFSASPILFLSVFLSCVCFAAYHFNLNENSITLLGLCSLNALTILFFLCL